MFGISGQEMIFWLFLAALVIGPSRLPEYARRLREQILKVKRVWASVSEEATKGAQETLKESGLDQFTPQALLGLDPVSEPENTFQAIPPPFPSAASGGDIS